jgi:hypothetical protein
MMVERKEHHIFFLTFLDGFPFSPRRKIEEKGTQPDRQVMDGHPFSSTFFPPHLITRG